MLSPSPPSLPPFLPLPFLPPLADPSLYQRYLSTGSQPPPKNFEAKNRKISRKRETA